MGQNALVKAPIEKLNTHHSNYQMYSIFKSIFDLKLCLQLHFSLFIILQKHLNKNSKLHNHFCFNIYFAFQTSPKIIILLHFMFTLQMNNFNKKNEKKSLFFFVSTNLLIFSFLWLFLQSFH